MSDETARLVASVAPNGDLDRRQETKAGVWEHYCEHPGCEKWARSALSKAGSRHGSVSSIEPMASAGWPRRGEARAEAATARVPSFAA